MIRESGQDCTVVRLENQHLKKGFLKNACFDEDTRDFYFKCAYSNVYYKPLSRLPPFSVTATCENDFHVYQACGFNHLEITNSEALCGGYFNKEQEWDGRHRFVECKGDNCKFEKRSNTSPDIIPGLCNHICDTYNCEDENFCNDHRYGLTCANDYGDYVSPPHICDGLEDCYNGSDEKKCSVTEDTPFTCTQYMNSWLYGEQVTVPIHNYTRCAVFDLDMIATPYCYEYSDQTNCSDIERVGGFCEVNGFMSSVSKYIVCLDYDDLAQIPIEVCDNDSQNMCVTPQIGCKIHKHRMCDGVQDCPDGSDEAYDMCFTTTYDIGFSCNRTFNLKLKNLAIPVFWIMDNVTDCIGGGDENPNNWQFCNGEFRQILVSYETCEDAFKCPGYGDGEDTSRFVPFDQLCDGIESCGNGFENAVCSIARDFPYIRKSAWNSWDLQNRTIRNACHSDSCEVKKVPKQFEVVDAFGVIINNEVLVPTSKVQCKEVFGEEYLFLSCMNMCLEQDQEVSCPVTNHLPLLYNSCSGQFLNRTYTVVNNSFLTFFEMSDKGRYHQDFYQCKNSKCVQYSEVCDLVDDCGDMSDEINCANHMICEDTLNSSRHQFVSTLQKCDGKYDCFDLSDECNDQCGREILENRVLKISCWLIGSLSMLLNFFAAVGGVKALKNCQTEKMMTSTALMSLIGLGDFLIGLYLVVLSYYDSFVFGNKFCRHQAEWLSGTPCLMLGVTSTLGSQISLFTMTILSVIRMYGLIWQPMRIPGPVDKKSIQRLLFLALATVTAAMVVAVTPLVPSLEDYFVQGMHYNSTYKVFIGFPSKLRHIKVLRSYYENNSTGNSSSNFYVSWMSWKEIREKVSGMFSQDYGKLTGNPVHFYGNDGVCLYKYFVKTNDARRSRDVEIPGGDLKAFMGDPVVWTILAVNFLCFLVITCCYIVITYKTKKSIRRSGQHHNPERLRNDRAIQNKIMIIISTDFICWVPFIVICALHNLLYIDASSWYASFSMVVLPLNSVINPLVYDKALTDFVKNTLGEIKVLFNLVTSTALTRTQSFMTQVFGTNDVEGEQEPDNIRW